MQNTIPSLIDALFGLAESVIAGLTSLEGPLEIQYNTSDKVQADYAAAKLANTALGSAISNRLTAAAAVDMQNAASVRLIEKVRDWLKGTLGKKYSQGWYAVGYRNHSLGTPRKQDGRVQLLAAMGQYLTAHPALEVSGQGITHTALAALHDAFLGAMNGLKSSWTTQRGSSDARDAAVQALRARLRAVLKELSQVLAPDDPRWQSFGFNIPADDSAPDAPASVTVSNGLPGHVLVVWPRALRAERYHVREKVLGVDDDYRLVKTTSETNADLNTFTSGQHVFVEVSAVNSAGESGPSTPVEHVIT